MIKFSLFVLIILLQFSIHFGQIIYLVEQLFIIIAEIGVRVHFKHIQLILHLYYSAVV